MPILELRQICKSFPGVKALDGVTLEFHAGQIHGLLGENGAGKSTAIKIITGLHQPDAGQVFLRGIAVNFRDPRAASAAGIGFVPQEISVISDASVAENIMIDKLITRRGVIDWAAVRFQARRHMDRVGLDVPEDTLVDTLSAAQKQLTQLAKALAANVSVLVLDEPTSSLTLHEAARLFERLYELRAEGVAIIFVSHKLEEVFAICDRVSVLWDGKFVASHATAEVTPAGAVAMMLGREGNSEGFGCLHPDWNNKVLEAENLIQRGRIHGVSFALHRGEILGFYGLVGSGRTEVARLLIGEERLSDGHVRIAGRPVHIDSVRESLYEHRLGYVSENRQEEGLFLEESVQNNLGVLALPRLRSSRGPWISERAETALAKQWVNVLDVRPPTPGRRAGSFSGGNQQKLSIGKWLAADCDILIIDEPTVGVDIGAKRQIHQLIWDLAAKENRSIILISSDLPEIVQLANRLLVFRSGKIVGEVRDIDRSAKSYNDVSREIAPFFTV